MGRKKKTEADGASAPDARKLGRTRIEVAAHQLRPAPWNPRPEITSESVADITASVREIGLIQPLVVIKDPDKPSYKGVDFYLIVAGHRRYRACVDAKHYPIPCDLIDCDVATAKRITMIENLQRKDVDPLMEADLIAGLIEGGMTQAEIAAETGRGERWVARRANLRKLSKSWRKRVADGDQITIDCLEHIAAYPEKIQEKCKDVRGGYYGEAMSWCSIRYTFRRESRDLRDVTFDTSPCLKCPNNTGCCPDLFDEDSRNHLGQCLDAKCYTKLIEEAVESAIAKAKKKGRVIVKGAPYKYGIYGETKRPTKTNTTLYVYEDGSGNKVLEYAAPPPKKDADAEKEAKAARREEKKRDKLIAAARIEAQEKFDEWFSERKKDGKWPKWIIDMALDDFYAHAEDVIDMWAAENGFTASDENANEVYREYLKAQKEAAEEAAKKREEHEPSDDAEDDGLPAEADDI